MSINGVRVAVTGIGMISPLGRGEKAVMTGKSNRSYSKKNVSTSCLQNHGATGELAERGWRATLLGLEASRMALEQAFHFSPGEDLRTGVIFGTSLLDLGALEVYLNAFRQDGPRAIPPWALHYGLPLAHASHIAVSLHLKGMCETLSDPVTAGISAIGMGYRVVALGEEHSLLAGGVDSPTGNILIDSLAKAFYTHSRITPAESCAVFHLQQDKLNTTPSPVIAVAYICGYETAYTGAKHERKEALIYRLANESFPDGEGIDLLLDTAMLPNPFPNALAGGSALACGLAVSLLDKSTPTILQALTQPSLLRRNRDKIQRIIVTTEGPAGNRAAIAIVSCRENSGTKTKRRYLAMSHDKQTTPKAAITGMGIASAIGVGRDAFFEALISGKSGVVKYVPPGLEGIEVTTAAIVPLSPESKGVQRSTQLAFTAIEEALLDAGLNNYSSELKPDLVVKSPITNSASKDTLRSDGTSSDKGTISGVPVEDPVIGLYLSETLNSVEAMVKLEDNLRRQNGVTEHEALADNFKDISETTADRVAKRFELSGEVLTFASGCTGGLFALGRAARDVSKANTPLILAGSSESNLFPFAIGVLSRAKLLTPCPDPDEAGRPFDMDRDGEVTGEGSVMFVVERADSAIKRGVKPYAIVSGFGTAGDAYHFKYNKPDGESLFDAAKMALDRANLETSDIGLVIAHASGFKGSDAIEIKALTRLFSGCTTLPPVISIKGATGQPFSVGGLLQVAAALCTFQNNIIPPTAHFKSCDIDDPFDHVPTARNPEKPIHHILITSYGYGGGKAAMVLSAYHEGK